MGTFNLHFPTCQWGESANNQCPRHSTDRRICRTQRKMKMRGFWYKVTKNLQMVIAEHWRGHRAPSIRSPGGSQPPCPWSWPLPTTLTAHSGISEASEMCCPLEKIDVYFGDLDNTAPRLRLDIWVWVNLCTEKQKERERERGEGSK